MKIYAGVYFARNWLCTKIFNINFIVNVSLVSSILEELIFEPSFFQFYRDNTFSIKSNYAQRGNTL